MTAALDRAVANALGLKSVNNCEKWSKTMDEDDDDIQVYKRPWVGLTDEERNAITGEVIGFNSCVGWEEDYARAVEQLLKEKNNG
jgi:hypothetical protein